MQQQDRLTTVLLVCCATAFGSAAASAQTIPWQVFVDGDTSVECALVNADNVELVVLDDTGQLVMTSALGVDLVDTVLVDSFVELDGSVFIGDAPSGVIGFAEDADGTVGLWWVSSQTEHIVRFDTVNNMPFETDGFPEDAVGDVCDPCTVWDDQSICAPPAGGGPFITINFCGANSAATMMLTLTGLLGMGLTHRPRRRPR